MLKDEFLDIFVTNMQKQIASFLENNADANMRSFNEEVLSKNNNSTDAVNKKLAKLSSCLAAVNERIVFDFTDNEQASREEFDVRKELMRSVNNLADELYKILPRTKEKVGLGKIKLNIANNIKAKLGKKVLPPDYDVAMKLLQSKDNKEKILGFTFTLIKRETILLLGVKPSA